MSAGGSSAAAGRPAILALDTATELCSAALLLGERLFAVEEEIGRGHAERILPMVDELLRAARSDGRVVGSGQFGAHMEVALVNDGPVTVMLEL